MIRVEQLFYRYPKNRADTLKNISFRVHKGEVFGFLGPSGAGKSTLQKILTGTLAGYRGYAEVLGPGAMQNRSSYYERIGVDFEFPNFYGKFTARENLRYFSSLYQKKPLPMEPLLKQFGLLEDADKRVNQFSKGMKTRLGFIRCLLHNPELLFLDEPTSGLDPANARLLKDMVKEVQSAGKTVILTTHNMHDAQELCSRVAFVVDGEIRAMDTPAALTSNGQPAEVLYTAKLANGSEERRSLLLQELGRDAAFLAALKENRVQSIHSKEPSLEDVFIALTGRRLQ